jgi:hypothetical protein
MSLDEVYKKVDKCFKTCNDMVYGDNPIAGLLQSMKNNIGLKDQLVNLEKYQSSESMEAFINIRFKSLY